MGSCDHGVGSFLCRVEEGETVIRTMVDYWVVARKSGHRRFMVLLNQRSSNFSEIHG